MFNRLRICVDDPEVDILNGRAVAIEIRRHSHLQSARDHSIDGVTASASNADHLQSRDARPNTAVFKTALNANASASRRRRRSSHRSLIASQIGALRRSISTLGPFRRAYESHLISRCTINTAGSGRVPSSRLVSSCVCLYENDFCQLSDDMVKKKKDFGEHDKKTAARDRRAANRNEEKERQSKEQEDQYWREAGEGTLTKAQARRKEQEKQKQAALAKKQEIKELAKAEDEDLAKSKKPKGGRVIAPKAREGDRMTSPEVLWGDLGDATRFVVGERAESCRNGRGDCATQEDREEGGG